LKPSQTPEINSKRKTSLTLLNLPRRLVLWYLNLPCLHWLALMPQEQ